MRKVLGCPSKKPKHLMFLELGWLPLRFIIKARRLNFLKYILNQNQTLLVKQVFNEQKLNPKRGDWVKDVEKDLKKLKICLTYDEITSMSKSSFKTLVKKVCRMWIGIFKEAHQIKRKRNGIHAYRNEKLSFK